MNASGSPVIVVLGGINMDLVATSARMPELGETVFGRSFHTAPGGKGANQAVAAARLGAEVRMVGRVGDDQFEGASVYASGGVNLVGGHTLGAGGDVAVGLACAGERFHDADP